MSLTFYNLHLLTFFQPVYRRSKMSDVVSVDFFWGPRRWILATTGRFPREWSDRSDRSDKLKFRFDTQEVRRGLGENLSLKLWWLLSTVAQAHVSPCDTWKHVTTTFHLILWYTLICFDKFDCTAWWLDHPWPVQILSTYDRASKRGWVSFSVCLVIEVILKLCWTSHFILGLLSNGKIERMRQSKCAMRQFHKIWNDFQFVAKLQFA